MEANEILFPGNEVQLGGRLMRPDGPGRCPGLVLVGGSGPSDRDNDGFFEPLSEHLFSSGLAVLKYDKRGAGRSSGSWEAATLDELAADAGAAVSVLRRHRRIAEDRVGVLGHSEGGWVALRLAARGGPVAHVILNSCPAVSFLQSEVYALGRAGYSTADAQAAGELMQALWESARSVHRFEDTLELLVAVEHDPRYEALRADGWEFDRTAWLQLREWGGYDPLDDLNLLGLPTLVVLGEADLLVPVDASVERYEITARRAGRAQQIARFPRAGHRLQLDDAETLAPGYLAALSDWCLNPDRGSAGPGSASGS